VEPSDAAVAVSQAVLGLVKERLSPEVSLDPFANRGRIVGVYETEPVLRAIAQLVLLEAEQLLEERIGVEFAGEEVPIPHTDTTRSRRAPILIVSGHGGLRRSQEQT